MTAIAKLHGRGLGCRFARDPRDKRYSLAQRLTDLDWQSVPERTTPWKLGPILDQGQTSQCTRYALAARRGARPIYTPAPLEDVTYAYYDWAINNDEFPGEDPEGGTSMRAMCQAGRQFGILSNFYNAADVLTVVRYITRFGPLPVGTEWDESMFTPDTQGFVAPIGAVAGGHAYLCWWHERANPDVEMSPDDVLHFQNSWGDWAQRGLFKMRLGDFRTLLEERGGEAYEPVELRHRPRI
jgi:hypothetical protein